MAEVKDVKIGYISSGGFSPSLGQPIAMGYLQKVETKLGNTVYTNVRGRRIAVTVSNLPAASGIITGQATVCQGENGAGAYSVSAITDATSYTWAYSGTGETVCPATDMVLYA